MTSPAQRPVSTTQIAELLAWARFLSDTGANADPNQRTAYQAAKTALLARITQTETLDHPQGTAHD